MAHSSAAKKADADFRISFARRSSRFSRSSSASRAATSVGTPAFVPASTSAFATQTRSVSGEIPSCAPIRWHAPFALAPGSALASNTNRIARSRSSSGYFLGAAISSASSWFDCLHQTRYGTGRRR
ncbi:hypothetical protein BBK14_17330 [Parafrankia soli]|uniref:Uncharacterized protein n=1 Tax=Parafrankia soli TaxID=2599596 RepID=A0A1S1Q1X5_9ACTN|nr:hypothetical protein BBK14_17330 [Parafrankia soli]